MVSSSLIPVHKKLWECVTHPWPAETWSSVSVSSQAEFELMDQMIVDSKAALRVNPFKNRAERDMFCLFMALFFADRDSFDTASEIIYV